MPPVEIDTDYVIRQEDEAGYWEPNLITLGKLEKIKLDAKEKLDGILKKKRGEVNVIQVKKNDVFYPGAFASSSDKASTSFFKPYLYPPTSLSMVSPKVLLERYIQNNDAIPTSTPAAGFLSPASTSQHPPSSTLSKKKRKANE